jgi:hypothetical protein
MRWTMQSNFGSVQLFVTFSIDATATSYEYGTITTLATGTQNQQTIGAADFGAIIGNEITISLSLDKINTAVGNSVFGMTSTSTKATSQILIGSSLTGGLLLNSDNATGSDFYVRESGPSPTVTPTPSPSVTPTPTNAGGRFDERYSGTLNPGAGFVTVQFELRRSYLDAQINQNHGDQTIYFELLDGNGNLIATANQQKIQLNNLSLGTYIYRFRVDVTKAVDFTVKSGQGN